MANIRSNLLKTCDVECHELFVPGHYERFSEKRALKSSRSPDADGIVKSDVMKICGVELAAYSAAAAVTGVRRFDERVAKILQGFLDTVDLLVDAHGGSLSWSSKGKSLFRDFSGSCRRGEIAQGLSYAYAMKKLGARAVFDFDEYLTALKACADERRKKPDYVLYYDGSHSNPWNGDAVKAGDVYLLETKLKRGINARAFEEGLVQCDSGAAVFEQRGLPVRCSYAADVWLPEEGSGDGAEVRVADPVLSTDCELVDLGNVPALREYAKWFYLAGDAEGFRALSLGESPRAERLDEIAEPDGVIGSWTSDGGLLCSVAVDRRVVEWLRRVADKGDHAGPAPCFESEYFKDGVKLVDGVEIRLRLE